MRARLVLAITALVATAGAVWYFGVTPLPPAAKRAGQLAGATPGTRNARAMGALAPEDLAAFATWLKQVPPDQRGPLIRERLATLSPGNAAARAKIRAFLLSGADADISRPGGRLPFDAGNTTLRRYLLGWLEEFPAEEAVPLARSVLAATTDLREACLALRALEHYQPDGNRPEALAAMQRLLPQAAEPAKPGPETTRYLEKFNQFAEPIAQYKLVEVHPAAMQAVAANPFLAGRYTQAVESFAPADSALAWQQMFANPAVAQELVGSAGTRSVEVWQDATYRQYTAQYFAAQMNDTQRRGFITALADETGLHYAPKPLTETKEPVLQPIDPAADTAGAKGRLAMLEAVAPQAKTPELQTAVADTRSALQEEIKPTRTAEKLTPIELPTLDPLGAPASAKDAPPAGQ